jgi:hypothetical protein
VNTTEQNINEAMSPEYQAIDRVKRHGEQNIHRVCEENLTVNPCKSAKITEGIRLREQQVFDVRLLLLWEHVQRLTEYKPEQVKAFTYRPEFLTKEEQKENRSAARLYRKPKYCDKNWHNAIRLRSGEVASMPGIARPIPPGWMPTSVERKL